MMKAMWWIAVLGLMVALGACAKQQEQGGTESAGKTFDWKMASSFAAAAPLNGETGPLFSEKLSRISGGRVNIRFFDPGKLVPALEVFDAVSKGAVDAGWSASGYWIGKIPASTMFTAIPFGPDNVEYLGWVYYGGGLELWRELYARHNVWVTPCAVLPPESSGWYRQEVKSVDQVKGLKMRFFGLGGKVMQKVGASVQVLAAGDIYPALERGVIDGLEYASPSLDEKLGFQNIAKHLYFPGWHQPGTIVELTINLDRWKELSPLDQELVEMACRDIIVRNLALGMVQQGPALARIKAAGVTAHTWPPEILSAFKKASDEVLEEEAAKDVDFARVLKSWREFHAQYQDWDKLSRPVVPN